jgi:glycosyltransferase involved in cell wall biosynthesis
MAVYNGERFLREAIDSILAQSLHDLELIVVNDGSSDKTSEVLASYADPRVRVVHKEINVGAAGARNTAITLARAPYIAIHDADDIALPYRLNKQFCFLEANASVSLVGSHAITVDEDGREKGALTYPSADDTEIKWQLLFSNPFIHSSVMLRRGVATKAGGYTEDPVIFRAFVEDYDLWSRIDESAKFVNFEEPLVKYRLSATSASSRTYSEQIRQTRLISQRNICGLLRWDRIDVASWERLERFLHHPVRQRLDLTSAEVNCTLNFLTTLHETFCGRLGLSKREAAAHRRKVLWPWGRHALALSYKGNGRRDAACRFSLFARGTKLVAKALWPA